MLLYRIGFPGWKLAAKLGVTLRVKVEIAHNAEANVFIATSPDLKGLVVEAETFEELLKEIEYCSNDLLHIAFERDIPFQSNIQVSQEAIA